MAPLHKARQPRHEMGTQPALASGNDARMLLVHTVVAKEILRVEDDLPRPTTTRP